MVAFLNRCIWTATSGGLGSFVVSAAVQNGYIPSSCANPVVVNGATYHYFANNAGQHEEGDGVWTTATSTLTRATIRNGSSGAFTPVNFSQPPTVFMGGPIATDMFTTVNIQTFTSSGTYTPTAGMLWCIIECVGGGGGGGSSLGSANFGLGAGGGSSGGYSRKTASAATIGASQVVTIGGAGTSGSGGGNGGNGGTTSLGSICTANGGNGGIGVSSGGGGSGGASPASGTGDIPVPGNPGGTGMLITATGISVIGVGGFGANSMFGTGGLSPISTNGNSAGGWGAGGSGASTNTATTTSGGAGSAGIVVITEFIV